MKTRPKLYGMYYSVRRLARCYLRYLSLRKVINISRACLSMLLRKTHVRSLPFALKIESCSSCNLRCEGCRSGPGAHTYRPGKLRLEDLNRILDEVGSTTVGITFYLWGEPMLNRRICDLVAETHRRKIATVISTNLHFPKPEMAEELVRAGLDLAIIAIDGVTQKAYEEVRIGGDLNVAMTNLNLLVEARRRVGRNRPIIEWQYVVTEGNKGEMEEAQRIARSLGVDVFTPIADWMARGEQEAEKASQKAAKKHPHPACLWLWCAAAIQWDGEVFPCCHIARYSKLSFGNCFEEELRSIWNNETYRLARQRFRDRAERSDDGPTPCHRCFMTPGAF